MMNLSEPYIHHNKGKGNCQQNIIFYTKEKAPETGGLQTSLKLEFIAFEGSQLFHKRLHAGE